MKIYEVVEHCDGTTMGIFSTEEAALAYAKQEGWADSVSELELDKNTCEFRGTNISWIREGKGETAVFNRKEEI